MGREGAFDLAAGKRLVLLPVLVLVRVRSLLPVLGQGLRLLLRLLRLLRLRASESAHRPTAHVAPRIHTQVRPHVTPRVRTHV